MASQGGEEGISTFWYTVYESTNAYENTNSIDSDDARRQAPRVHVRKHDLVLPELSYQIVGALFDVYNEIGFGHREHIYQRAVAEALRSRNISFVEQLIVPLKFNETKIGTYRLDFLIDDAIILEIKQGDRFRSTNIKQVHGYLKSLEKELAILANFIQKGVLHRRIVNIR